MKILLVDIHKLHSMLVRKKLNFQPTWQLLHNKIFFFFFFYVKHIIHFHGKYQGLTFTIHH